MIIHDAHTHIFPEKIAEKATKSIGAFYNTIDMKCNKATSECLNINDSKINVQYKLVCSSAVTKEQVDVINAFISSECKKNPSFIGFAALHPDTENYEEVIEYACENNLKGIKFHPDFQKFNIDDSKMFDVYRAIEKKGLTILFHTGDNRYDFSSPERLKNVLHKIPDLRVIAAHFGGYMKWDLALKLPNTENLYFDTSSSLSFIKKDTVLKFIERFGDNKFLFGTDFPMWNAEEELNKFLSLDLGKKINDNILHKNFENFLKV